MRPPLAAAPLLVDLGPDVLTAGLLLSEPEAVIAALADLVSAEGLSERAVPKRRAEFLAGRWAARQALRSLGHDSLPIRRDDGSPGWPADVVGSITHGAGRALSAVAHVRDVRSLGIDVERLMGEQTKAELMARICSEEERATLARGVEAPEPHLVTLAFSAKESLYKCLFPLVGRFMDFSAAHVVGAAGGARGGDLVGQLTLELAVDWSEGLRRGQRLQAPFVVASDHVQTAVLLRP